MLIKQVNINTQRHYDSLHFNTTQACDTAIDILENNCIHLKSKNTIIYITDHEAEKLEAIKPMLENHNIDQLKNITNIFCQPTIETNISAIEKWFNKNIGWFFKNGNK
ncbi:hypothetical protein [Seonamhaeicola sp.]|uniref:hypothetical protein n=1 Tax=Seonamhaeicola sp. TaxID=1912245 RepID=UPI00356B3395